MFAPDGVAAIAARTVVKEVPTVDGGEPEGGAVDEHDDEVVAEGEGGGHCIGIGVGGGRMA